MRNTKEPGQGQDVNLTVIKNSGAQANSEVIRQSKLPSIVEVFRDGRPMPGPNSLNRIFASVAAVNTRIKEQPSPLPQDFPIPVVFV